jgi:hypothetical protein
MLAKMEGKGLNPEHVKSLLKDQSFVAAAGQSAKPTPESAKSTATIPVGLGVPESAKPTHELAKPSPPADTILEALESARLVPESAEPTPTVLMAFEVSSNDFASTVAAMVGMKVLEVPDEEMVDYEATPERGEVNVVVLSADYYIVEDDSAAAVFNFLIQDATFKKPE